MCVSSYRSLELSLDAPERTSEDPSRDSVTIIPEVTDVLQAPPLQPTLSLPPSLCASHADVSWGESIRTETCFVMLSSALPRQQSYGFLGGFFFLLLRVTGPRGVRLAWIPNCLLTWPDPYNRPHEEWVGGGIAIPIHESIFVEMRHARQYVYSIRYCLRPLTLSDHAPYLTRIRRPPLFQRARCWPDAMAYSFLSFSME